jgi:hypothetical protein
LKSEIRKPRSGVQKLYFCIAVTASVFEEEKSLLSAAKQTNPDAAESVVNPDYNGFRGGRQAL